MCVSLDWHYSVLGPCADGSPLKQHPRTTWNLLQLTKSICLKWMLLPIRYITSGRQQWSVNCLSSLVVWTTQQIDFTFSRHCNPQECKWQASRKSEFWVSHLHRPRQEWNIYNNCGPSSNKSSTSTRIQKVEVPKVVSMNAETTFYLFQNLMGANHLRVHRGLPWKKLSFWAIGIPCSKSTFPWNK
jgi:hypothetical protein